MSPPSPDHEDDALWDLLRQGEAHRASPFFARNVLRELRQAEARAPLWKNWLRPWRYAVPAAAAVMAVCAGLLMVDKPSDSPSTVARSAPFTVARIEADPDYEVIAELDTLIAYENNTQWLDSSLSN